MPTSIKNKVFNLIPPAMIAAVLMFWAYAPKAILDHGSTLIVTSFCPSSQLI